MQWDVYSAIKKEMKYSYMLQYGQILKTLCQLKEASHKSPHTVFYLYEITSTVKSIEKKKQISGWQWLGEGNTGN